MAAWQAIEPSPTPTPDDARQLEQQVLVEVLHGHRQQHLGVRNRRLDRRVERVDGGVSGTIWISGEDGGARVADGRGPQNGEPLDSSSGSVDEEGLSYFNPQDESTLHLSR
jgi:hypothetical protein